ncbi:MAG: pterin-binding protein [Chloroflexi bacterium]|nr:pterin-binding protein [Chloroflexota bacterium]MBM4450399.1 pterin-binding protein [Chloroflexota bacterium]
METMVSSAMKEVIIGHDRPTVLIGERINPTGKKKLAEALKAGNLEIICEEALAQAQAGADIIDVNVSTFGVDEVTMLPRVVQTVLGTVDIPLCLDSANPEALAAALKVYKGKPLINSVTGEERSLSAILPLVKEYGAAVIGLVQDDDGIPNDAERRVAVARKIVKRAEATGIPRQDIIIDPLALTIGADTKSGLVTIETVRRVKAELGVNIVLAVSNVSHGMPDRDLLNNAFVAMAIAAGVTCLVVDVAKVRSIVLAADLLLGKDEYARRYIKTYRQRGQQTPGG